MPELLHFSAIKSCKDFRITIAAQGSDHDAKR